jgi:16S rRNA (uracil1498-N3)-methyltransferase
MHEDESGTPVKSWLKHFETPAGISFAIGPEGGFTEGEVVSFVSSGFKQLKLGPEVLRTETAPVAMLSILNYIYRW